MKIQQLGIGRVVLLVGAFLTLTCVRTAGQSAAASRVGEQQNQVAARVTQVIDDTNRVVLRGSVHPLARPEFDQGAVEESRPMNRMLLLLQRSAEQESALQQLMEEQQLKSSLNYHAWLTPEQFGKRFGPADADIQAVTDWLTSQGFQGIKVGAGRSVVEFSGNVGQVRRAFHTEIHEFNVNGKTRQANVNDPEIPVALKPVVSGIDSLHNFPKKSLRHLAGAYSQMADGHIVPQFTSSTPGKFYAVGPADFATIYNIPTTTLAGTNSTIAIVGTSNIRTQDVTDFQNLFGLPVKLPNVILDGPDPGLAAEEGEAILDVEWAGAVAPGATVDFVVAEDTLTASGIDLSAVFVIDNNLADVMSLSFGGCLSTSGQTFFNQLWQQAAAQGITVTVASGDAGSAACDNFTTAKTAVNGLAVSGLAATPFNVAVGGTDFDDVTAPTTYWNTTNSTDGKRESAKGYIPETTWNNSCAATATSATLTTVCSTANNIVAGSGGRSAVNAKPAWQNALTPADGARDIPDVSLFASDGPTSKNFYVVCQADGVTAGIPPSCAPDAQGHFSFIGVGGTSASTPAFAGIMALIGQSESVAGRSRRQGNANLVLYKIAQSEMFGNCNSSSFTNPLTLPPSGCAFLDITKGNVSVPCSGGSLNCSSGTTGTNGVLVDPAQPTIPAWITKPGYDYATGLGSVNVANLAAAWPTAVGTFKSTTTSLKINGSTTLVTINHGSSVAATVSVTSTGGTPSGDISLIAPTSVNGGVGTSTLTGGSTTFNTSLLPGGSYNLTAHYAGDGTFAPSDSNPVPVVVKKENSRLQMGVITFDPITHSITSTAATSFAYGSPYILRFDILNSSGGPCQAATRGTTTGCAFDATGMVTVTDNAVPLDAGTFPINSAGHAEDQPIQLAPGTHNISATYSGDISYSAPASPSTSTLTVSQATTSVQVTPSPSTIISGGSVTLTAKVTTTSNGAGPTGTVQFKNGSTAIGSPVTCTPTAATSTIAASCTATLSTTLAQVMPVLLGRPSPQVPVRMIWTVTGLLLMVFLLGLRRLPAAKRPRYAYAGLVLFAVAAAAIAGCSGTSNGRGHAVVITATYSGDINYSGSSGTAPVAVQ